MSCAPDTIRGEKDLALGLRLLWIRRRHRRRAQKAPPSAEELPDVPETTLLIYEHSKGGPARQGGTSDALELKAFQSFAAASVVLGFGSFTTGHLSALTAALYAAAALS